VGGTKIAGGVVAAESGAILARRIIPTQPERGGQAVLHDTLAMAKALMTEAVEADRTVLGIGLGVAELVDLVGNVTSAHTIAWQGLPVQQRFAQLARTVVESDARAPALAEAIYGAGRPFKLFTYLTIGTGISYCLVQDGRPYAGARGNALVLANSPMTLRCPNCGAISKPILEEVASGPGLVAAYNEHTGKQETRAEAVIAAAEAGEPIAFAVVTSAAEMLGAYVGLLVNILDPEAVIVGGGLGLAGGLYWDTFITATQAHIYSEATATLPILPAALGRVAGLIGAAAAIFQRYS
jgi:glucokinase